MTTSQSTRTFFVVPAGTKTADIQELIDCAPPGSTIRLEAGDFAITQTLTINRSDITLKGTGKDDTRLIQSSSLTDAPVIQIGPDWAPSTMDALPALEHAAQTGSRTIRFEDNHGLQAGDVIYISQENTPEFFEEIGDTEWQKDSPLRTFMVTVERVGGKSIVLSESLPFDFDPSITTVSKMSPLTDVTISDFEVTTTYGRSDPSDFSNTIRDEYRGNLIDISNTVGVVVDDVNLTEAGSNGINIATSLNAEVNDITIHGAHNKGSGGNGYGIQIRDVYHSTFSDIEVHDTRHGVLFASYQSAVGNTVEVTGTNRDINFHGGLDRDNTVVVDESIRTPEEQDYMSASAYFNEGESWGAPTDPTLNSIVFREVNGTTRADTIVAHDDGAKIWGYRGSDELHGGTGDDRIYGQTGKDTIYESLGRDRIDGGSGTDRYVLKKAFEAYTFTEIDDGFVIHGHGGRARVEDVETFQFADMTLSQSTLEDWI